VRLPGEKQKETVKLLIMGALLFIACFLTYYYHVVLKTGTVFTHFFYIPIVGRQMVVDKFNIKLRETLAM
jgi:hypothetical protein